MALGLQCSFSASAEAAYGFPYIGPGPAETSTMDIRPFKNVREILLPLTGELPPQPSVHLDDPITMAIEVMVKHNVDRLPVLWNARPVGQVRLQDAFAIVGIRVP